MKFIHFVLSAILISACSTLISSCTTTPKLPEPDIKAQLGQPQPGKAVLITYRRDIKPERDKVTATLNGEAFAELGNQNYHWSYLEPGTHKLETTWPKAALIPKATREITLEAGQYYLVEMRGLGIAVVFDKKELNPSNTQIKTGSYEEALQWLDNCCRLVESKGE
jgi:hypothetical protein